MLLPIENKIDKIHYLVAYVTPMEKVYIPFMNVRDIRKGRRAVSS
jgi:hypothetical protein